jgi:hypothetical protein
LIEIGRFLPNEWGMILEIGASVTKLPTKKLAKRRTNNNVRLIHGMQQLSLHIDEQLSHWDL